MHDILFCKTPKKKRLELTTILKILLVLLPPPPFTGRKLNDKFPGKGRKTRKFLLICKENERIKKTDRKKVDEKHEKKFGISFSNNT